MIDQVEEVLKKVPVGALISSMEIADDLGLDGSWDTIKQINECCRILVNKGKPVRYHSYCLWERLL